MNNLLLLFLSTGQLRGWSVNYSGNRTVSSKHKKNCKVRATKPFYSLNNYLFYKASEAITI